MKSPRLIVAITGASGAFYGVRLLELGVVVLENGDGFLTEPTSAHARHSLGQPPVTHAITIRGALVAFRRMG